MRVEAETRAQEEHDHKIWEEAQHIVQEKVMRVAWWEKQLEGKLTTLLVGELTQADFEEDSKGEESKVVGTEDVGTTGGTQSSVMELDNREDKVVVVGR